MARRIRRNSALREALIARKHVILQRWSTDLGRKRLAAMVAGEAVSTDSGELFSALYMAGNPEAMRFARGVGPDRRFVLTDKDELVEVDA